MQPNKWRGLNIESAKHYYDKFGSKQDKQGFYEDHALKMLIENGRFGNADSVFELGCGTGRFAEELLNSYLNGKAVYSGVDVSTTMLRLSKERLKRFGSRIRIETALDLPLSSVASSSIDRFIANYVLDLFSDEDASKTLEEAHRILSDEGLVCLTSITDGKNLITGFVSLMWDTVFKINPSLVGGCRPINLLSHLDPSKWKVVYHYIGSKFAVTSEVLIASPVR